MKRINVTKESKENFTSVRNRIDIILREHKYTRKVAVDIYGIIEYMDEAHVRALQVMAKRAAEESDEAFTEFCDNIKVYSGSSITKSHHVMHFRKDGKFVEEFDKGFFNANANLMFKIL